MIGKTILHYKILEKLGEGGMGVVYKALDTKLNREVAIKFLPHQIAPGEEERQRFKVEAQAAAALNHPNIATIYAVEEVDGETFIVMEYIKGQELKDIIHSSHPKMLDMRKVVEYATQIADGLQAAHEEGVIHRDIKSANIMITEKSQVKIMDFGLAKVRGGDELTKEHSTLGTAAYMSPEQALGKKDIDHRTDIWSFGVVLYEMLTGQLPFRGEYDSAVLYSIMNEEPESVELYRSDTPPAIVHILDRVLEKSAEDRYQSMPEIGRELHRLKKQQSEVARRSVVKTSTSSGGIASEKGFQAILGGRQTKLKKRIRKLSLLIIGSIIVVAIAFQIYRFFSGEKTAPTFQNMEFSQLTHTGDVLAYVAISPDGKSIAYVTENRGKYSLWVRQTATIGQIQIVPPDESSIWGPAFSHNGEFIYYSSSENIYRIPAFGGSPERIMEGINSQITVSPDEKQIAFVRINRDSLQSMAVIADINGSNEKIIAVRDLENGFYLAPAWSPDGRSLAAPVRINKGGKSTRTVVEIPVTGGAEKQLTSFEWTYGLIPAWLPDGSGIIIVGSGQIYRIALPSGDVTRITNDLHEYLGLSVSRDGNSLVTVKVNNFSSIWIMSNLDMKSVARVTPDLQSWAIGRNQGLAWTPDNKIVCSTDISGNLDLWLINSDGSNMKQLTFHKSDDIHPVMLPDGKTIIFVSKRSGSYDIWRMDINGDNLKRLTFVNANHPFEFSANKDWVVYRTVFSSIPGLWRVSIAGGTPEKISEYEIRAPQISPDGTQIACHILGMEFTEWKIGGIPITGGKPTVVFDGVDEYDWWWKNTIQWTRDGRALTYFKTENDVSNIWLQPLNGSKPQQITDFKTDRIWHFTWSLDGKQLAMARGRRSSDVVMIRNFR